MAKTKKKNYTYAVGKRKTASARVRLHRGEGQHMVNERPIGEYFPGKVAQVAWSRPFEVTQTAGKYYATVKVVGSGKRAQLTAVIHGVARALVALKAEKYRPLLRKAGLLTRDARERQRRMVGKGGKSRRTKQSPKR